ARLQLLADTLPELVAFVDRKGIVRFANTAFSDWFASTNCPVGRSIATVLGEAVGDSLAACIATALDGKATSHDLVLTHQDRGERLFQASHIPHIVDNKVLGFYLL